MSKFTGAYFVVLPIVLSVAPSLGFSGTVFRFALGVAGLVLSLRLKSDGGTSTTRASTFLLAAIGASLIVATFLSPSIWFGLSRLLNWALFIPLFFVSRAKNTITPFLRGILLASGVQMIGVFLQYRGVIGGLWGGQIVSGIGYDPNYSQWLTRYTGFILDANSLGSIFAISVITSLHFSTQNDRSRFVKASLFTFAGLNLFGIFLTGSRGAILITAFSIAAYLVLSRNYSLIAYLLPATALVVLAGQQFASFDFLVTSIANIFDGTDSSANNRTALWQYALSRAGELQIFFGDGFGARNPSLFAGQNSLFVDPVLLKFTTFDNAWLKTLLEMGAFSVASLSALFLLSFTNNLATRKGNSSFDALPIAVLTYFVLRSISVDSFDINPWNSVIWIILGTMLRPARTTTSLNEQKSNNQTDNG